MKRMISFTIRKQGNEQFGFRIVGGKDAERSCRVEKVNLFSPAHEAGMQTHDYLVTVQGRSVFGLNHDEVVNIIQNAGNTLEITVERGDHIVPTFHEIWPNNFNSKTQKSANKPVNESMLLSQKGPNRGPEYFLNAMSSGIPGKKDAVFTTVGKPKAQVIQYDNPINCYSKNVVDEMMEESVNWKKCLAIDGEKKPEPWKPPPKVVSKPAVSKIAGEKTFDPRNSNVLAYLAQQDELNPPTSSGYRDAIYNNPLPRYFY